MNIEEVQPLIPIIPLHNTQQTGGSPSIPESPTLKRHLSARVIAMIAIGGTIGSGLFLGSSKTIVDAGPIGALVAYTLIGLLVYATMTSIGELSVWLPTSGGFTTHALRVVSPGFGMMLGYAYWLQWTVSLAAEVGAIALLVQKITGSDSTLLGVGVALTVLSFLLGVQLMGTRSFGEAEYWLSLVKVVAIIVFIFIGMSLDLGYFFNKPYIGTQNWYIDGAPAFKGIRGLFDVFLLAFYSFGGCEIGSITAGEAENPRVTIPKAIKSTFFRILLFYILSILVMGLVIPNNDPRLVNLPSPFTLIFEMAGLPAAAKVMDFVIFTAIISASNSALFAASRTLFSLSKQMKAHEIFSRISTNGVPYVAILTTVFISTLLFLIATLGERKAFLVLVTLTGIQGVLTWLSIVVIHVRFRRAMKAQGVSVHTLVYRSPYYPLGPIVAFTLGSIIVIGQAIGAYNESISKLCISFSTVPFFAATFIYLKFVKGEGLIPLKDVQLEVEDIFF